MQSNILINVLNKIKIFVEKYKFIILVTSTLIFIDQISKFITTNKLVNNEIYIPTYIGKII